MKVHHLLELSAHQETLLKIAQVLPHMDAGGMMIDAQTVAKFTGMPASTVAPVLGEYTKRIQPKHMIDGHHSEEVNAVIALAYLLKNNQLNQSKISKKMLEELTNLPYEDIVKIARDNLQEIQKAVTAFRPSWVVPVERKGWNEYNHEEQKEMIIKHMEHMLSMKAENVTAKDIASSILHTGKVTAKDPDSVRRDIDRFLSSNDPEAMKLNAFRPVGRTVRSVPDDITPRHNRSWVRAP